jgi:hypothetical protein
MGFSAEVAEWNDQPVISNLKLAMEFNKPSAWSFGGFRGVAGKLIVGRMALEQRQIANEILHC